MVKRILLCLTICVLLAGQAWADGKFFSAANDVMQPDQKALLWRDGGRETLLLQVKYEGEASDFGWVVPVPARPKLDTASSEIFHELAWITQPVHVTPWWSKYRGMTAGGIEGVTVVEQAEVGPYDATVLAATDARGLSTWLEDHGYAMPPGAARVLRSYVDRQWYYVAARVNPQRVYDELLADLRQIDPEIETLEEAPDPLAFLVLQAADAHPQRGRELLARLTAITDKAQGVPEDLEAAKRRDYWFAFESMVPGSPLLEDLDEYYAWRRGFLSDLVAARDATAYADVIRRGTDGDDRDVLRAATAAGMEHDGTVGGFQDALLDALAADIANDIVWKESRVARLLAELTRTGHGLSQSSLEQLRDDYQTRRIILQEHSRVPPCDYTRSRELRDQAGAVILGSKAKWDDAVYRLNERERLYAGTRWAVEFSAEALEAALHSGSIAPLRLEFDCKDLVYPLYMTSLNGAPVDIQVYVLADHRMEAEGFETTFAGRLDEEALEDAPETARLVAAGRDYLTELRATLAPEQMTADLLFARARTDKPHREEIVRGGGLHPFIVIIAIVLLIFALGVMAIIYSAFRQALAGRRS